MKQVLKLAMISAVLSLTYSCNDDLLNNSGVAGQSQPTASLTSAQAEDAALTNADVPAAFVNGIYGQMIQTGGGGTTGHDDFGHKAYDVFSDMMSSDMALSVSTYGWYRAAITEYQAMSDFTWSENREVWRYFYRIVRSANNVINSLGGNDAIPALDNNKAAMAQAKTMRAQAYFHLAQFYQREYNPTQEILPLYTVAGTTNLPKSKASDVYALITKDIEDARSLFKSISWSRSVINQVNLDVTEQIGAMVYALMGSHTNDNALTQKAANFTRDIIARGNHTILPATQLTNGFNSVYNQNSWMWGIDLTENIGLGLVSWWGQVDAWSYSYAWAGDYKAIDINLYNSMHSSDGRRAQFLPATSTSSRRLQPLYKFAASNRIGGTSTTVTADYVYMRIEEAYLLNAEANARLGNTAAARTSLMALVNQRITSATELTRINGLTGQALLDEIYKQTRLELWGEGKSFFALKRNKATIVRGTNHLSLVGVPIPYNDNRLEFEIPQDEIQNNPFVNDQNQ